VPKKRTVFISYSHADKRWLEILRTALAPLTSAHRIDAWHDQRIPVGSDWRSEINTALDAANTAVLLVTPNFFASDFIMKKELPVLLKRREKEGLPLVSIAVSATSYHRTQLRDIQTANNPERPLDALRVADRNKALVAIVDVISSASATSGVGAVLKTTDAVTPAIISMSTGRRTRKPAIVTQSRRGRVELHEDGHVIDVIDPPDLRRLSNADRLLINTYQASMAAAFARWQSLYPRRDTLTTAEQRSLRRARLQMCEDLGKVIDYLDQVGKHLPDHYRTVRYECEQLRQRGARSA
jgi:hypothetical protein